jgi:hypothetical protein
MPPTTPDVRPLDKSESNISPNAPEYDGESKDKNELEKEGTN